MNNTNSRPSVNVSFDTKKLINIESAKDGKSKIEYVEDVLNDYWIKNGIRTKK